MAGAEDFRTSRRGRRTRWYGLKGPVKRVLGWRAPHAVVRRVASAFPSIAASGRLPAPAHLHEITGRVGDRTFVMLRPDRCVVAKELYWGGGRRPRPADRFALELFARLAEDADVVLDVGAYTGIFTLAAAAVSPGARIHSFEIVPDVFHLLLDNCVRNDALPRVTLHHVGVGEEADPVRIPTGSGGSALPDFYSRRLHFRTGALIGFRPLDDLLPLLPDEARIVMKVDVEGTEHGVLRSGERLLERFRPDVLCEVLAGVAEPAKLEALLAPLGYGRYLVEGGHLSRRDRIEPDAAYRDWLFTVRSPEDLASIGIPVAPS